MWYTTNWLKQKQEQSELIIGRACGIRQAGHSEASVELRANAQDFFLQIELSRALVRPRRNRANEEGMFRMGTIKVVVF